MSVPAHMPYRDFKLAHPPRYENALAFTACLIEALLALPGLHLRTRAYIYSLRRDDGFYYNDNEYRRWMDEMNPYGVKLGQDIYSNRDHNAGACAAHIVYALRGSGFYSLNSEFKAALNYAVAAGVPKPQIDALIALHLT